MKIVFMGTPDFSVPCLRALVDNNYEISAVFTQPDKPKGRGYKMIAPPVKICAEKYNIPVFQPISLKKGEDAEKSMDVLKNISPDIIIVVAYGQILPKEILELPKYGCVNIHASLLPQYRGAAPIQRCILDGMTKTGVTSMLMEEGLDTGDMLISAETQIGENETSSELHDRLSDMGAKVLIDTITAVENGTLNPQKQDDEKSNYAKMITKNMSALNFNKSAEEVHNVIRAITGFTMLEGKRLKIYRSCIVDISEAEPGSVTDEKNLIVACGDGKGIKFLEVQYEGSKRMSTDNFLRGRKVVKGQKLG